MKQYNLCFDIAKKAHEGQKRKFSNLPYFVHPERVSQKFKEEKMICIALLHDVLEDTKITKNDLLRIGIDESVIKVVEILTRRKDETYFDFILRISKHKEATLIKIEDITDNLRDLKEGSLKDKYRLARYLLMYKE